MNAICKGLSIIFMAVMTTLPAKGAEAFVTEYIQQDLARQNAKKWQAEDKAIDAKLAELARKNGKRPNIIFILSDDIGWGELGSYGGGKLRGTPTDNLDAMAAEGIKLLQHYSEPSCTPTRVSLMTGRMPVRTGMDSLLWPGSAQGLVAEEYTIASLLSDAGYKTALFGKWHLGEHEEHLPNNHGFDYAYYTLYNGAVWPWEENSRHFDSNNETIGEVPYFLDLPADYKSRYAIDVGGIYEGRKNQKAKKVADLSLERYNTHDNELTNKVIDYVRQVADSKDPFFVYFASNTQQVFGCPPEERSAKYVDHSNCQAAQLVQHDKNVRRILDALDELKIAENTVVFWVSDNGPMYFFHPSSGFSYLDGEKGSVKEGGVRVPAIIRWKNVITPGQDPIDIVHVTDWYVTMARLAGAMDKIPADRVIDGVDQTSLLLNGEGHSHRNYLYLYTYRGHINYNVGAPGAQLAAVRLDNIKMYLQNGAMYNIMRDPQERINNRARYLWTINPLQRMVYDHNLLIKHYPNRKLVETGGSENQ